MNEAPDPEVLSAATERLNVALCEAEGVLRNLNLRVSASVPLDDLGRTLQFRKVDRTFQLLVAIRPGEVQHITSVSRESRVRAAEKLPLLRRALLQNYETEVERVNGAADAVIAFVAATRERRDVP